MSTAKRILALLAITAIAAAALVAWTSTAHAADPTTPHYSDGVTFNTEADWGAPSDLHIAEDGRACIDPPYWVWLTLHVEVNGVESAELTQVFPYEHNVPGYVCVDFPMPACPDDTQDVTWSAKGSWNIGSGFSNEIGGTIDCTPEVIVPEVPVEVPVELAPPAVQVATPAATPVATPTATPVTELAATGAADDVALAMFALGIIGVGYLMGRQAKAKRGLL